MTNHFFVFIFLFLNVISGLLNAQSTGKKFALVIHGGAGTILKENMSAELEQSYYEKMEEALDTGALLLEMGYAAIDVVEKVIIIMENSPLFNAGKGAVFTHGGYNELDASIMDGKTLNAGAVAGVRKIKNPISLAKEIMYHSPHVMLSGKGAEEFALERNFEMMDTSYFFTPRRWENLMEYRHQEKFGTVGCAVLDKKGNLAAGTSTGGMTNKKHGRIGDSPIIGAGTYANNNTCAISSTGEGEYFIRLVIAHGISAMMEYSKKSLKEAASVMIQEKLTRVGGKGGVIGLDREGNIVMIFNTPGMYRGYACSGGGREILIYK